MGTTVAVVVAAVLCVLCLLFSLIFMTAAAQPLNNSFSGSVSGQPSSYARKLIPPKMLALYMSDSVRAECPNLSWTIVAAIIHLESNDNRNPGVSSAGARGASQFMPTTWDRQARSIVNVGRYGRIPTGQGYAMDGDGDGLADIMNPYDSVPATARYLCASGAGDPAKLRTAIFAYNRAWWYVDGGMSEYGTQFIGIIPLAAKLADPPSAASSGGWQLPLTPGSYVANSPYGMRFHPKYHVWRLHEGQDMAPKSGQAGDPIFAIANGRVLSISRRLTGKGNSVLVDHGGTPNVASSYSHMLSFAPGIVPGATVQKGQVLGRVGTTGTSTGEHLHLEIEINGTPVDPKKWLADRGVNI
jgi:murein DD-endopeptidase MepM/ murein hydrolase activator NlpD